MLRHRNAVATQQPARTRGNLLTRATSACSNTNPSSTIGTPHTAPDGPLNELRYETNRMPRPVFNQARIHNTNWPVVSFVIPNTLVLPKILPIARKAGALAQIRSSERCGEGRRENMADNIN